MFTVEITLPLFIKVTLDTTVGCIDELESAVLVILTVDVFVVNKGGIVIPVVIAEIIAPLVVGTVEKKIT